MLNVLHLLNYLGNGGTEVYIHSLGKKLHNKSCKFYIAYSEEGKGRNLFHELEIDLIKLNMSGPVDIKAALELKKICKNLSIDVIHTHFLRENYIAILSKIIGNNIKIINTRHMLIDNSKAVIISNKVFTKFNKKIIAVSSSVKDQLLGEGIDSSKIELIYNGIDLDEWRIPTHLSFRDEFNIKDDDIVITSVARFSEEKGHEFFLKSINLFNDNGKITNQNIKFVLVGEGPLLDSIKDQSSRFGLEKAIIFTGFRRDIKNILKSSDLYVSHSKSEAFGISILEAIAAGLPVISTNSGGASEIINDGFNNGILINYGDEEKLVESLISLIEDQDLSNRLKDRGYDVVKQYFDLETSSKSTYEVYESN